MTTNKPSPRVVHAMILDLADRMQRGLRPATDANDNLRQAGKLLSELNIEQADWLRTQLLEFAETNGMVKPQGFGDFTQRGGGMVERHFDAIDTFFDKAFGKGKSK